LRREKERWRRMEKRGDSSGKKRSVLEGWITKERKGRGAA